MPACVPRLESSLVLTNFTKSQYSRSLNDSKFTGMGIDEEDVLFTGINSYRTSQNLTILNKNENAECLADELAEQFKNRPCTNNTGSATVPGTEPQFADYPKILTKCHVNVSDTRDGSIMPACVPRLESSLVLTNFTKSQYSRSLNDSKFTGMGIGLRGDLYRSFEQSHLRLVRLFLGTGVSLYTTIASFCFQGTVALTAPISPVFVSGKAVAPFFCWLLLRFDPESSSRSTLLLFLCSIDSRSENLFSSVLGSKVELGRAFALTPAEAVVLFRWRCGGLVTRVPRSEDYDTCPVHASRGKEETSFWVRTMGLGPNRFLRFG
ncbi:hypothetical protein F2Q68_00033146 [Brassica cretica]|uniref:Uncharacterized GPI-anchored protein At5g19230-like domain-containing protein n=1 Tax=Brassica cretica TaxID=69181 RepID=A0A8S9GGK2_BRACR|nr:hypothetical protein F2Q68_00033146 [Brassica cretica]